jgi:uncharacterized C2H2 Zn-finger protein
MKCPRCEGLVRVGKQGEYSRCFNCGWHNWETPMPPKKKRKNVMYLRYGKRGKNRDFKDKILRVTSLPGSPVAGRSRSRANPSLMATCPFHCEGELITESYNEYRGYSLICKRKHRVTVKLNLEVPRWL